MELNKENYCFSSMDFDEKDLLHSELDTFESLREGFRRKLESFDDENANKVIEEQYDYINHRISEIKNNINKLELNNKQDYPVNLPPFIVNEINPPMGQSEITDWGLQLLDIPKIHDLGITGEGIRIAVIGTGVNVDHPDLAGAVEKTFNTTNEPYSASNGHECGSAGVIAARRNDKGVLGVAPGCKIIAIKALSESGSGNLVDIIEAINIAIQEGVHIINMSLGGGGTLPALKEAVDRAAAAGILVVSSAGNSGTDNSVGYPAKYPSGFAVASINRDKKISSFSSRGPEVDVASPGEKILTCWKDNGYATVSGTCIRGDQWVHIDDGYKEISKIEIGDRVETFNEDTHEIELNRVTNKISNGIKTVYNVKTTNGEIVCTDNHPFLQGFVEDAGERNVGGQRSYDRSLKWTQIKDLHPGDVILQHQVKKDSWDTSRVLHEVKKVLPFFNLDTAYSIGYWLGDGWYTPHGLAAYAKNEFWEKLVTKFEKGFPQNSVRSSYREDRNEYNVFVTGSELKSNLISLGVLGGAKNKEIPSFVFGLPLKYREAVLAGIFDSDGSINDYENGRNAVLKVSSFKFAKGFKKLMESMDIRCSNVFEQTKSGGTIRGRQLPETTSFSSTTYQFYKLKPIQKHLLNEDYVDLIDKHDDDTLSQNSVGRVMINGVKVRPPRLENEDLYFGKIVEIREIGEEEVWDITVEGNHNFLCENFVVHNSFSGPFVSGCFALLLQAGIKPTLDLLKTTSIDIEEPGFDNKSGYGIINTYNIIKNAVGVRCASVSELIATNITQNSLILSWTGDPSAKTYVIDMKSGDEYKRLTETDKTTINVTDMRSDTVYEFRVKPICDGKESDYSSVSAKTLTATEPPKPPDPPKFDIIKVKQAFDLLGEFLNGLTIQNIRK